MLPPSLVYDKNEVLKFLADSIPKLHKLALNTNR